MGTFSITAAVLHRLCDLNCFGVPNDRAVLFGIRGCLPLNEKEYGALGARQLETIAVNYSHPRCTLGVWLPGEQVVAAFPGSTVPHQTSIPKGVGKEGMGCNQLVPSLVRFERGLHPRKKDKAQHPAFLQAMDFAVQRTADDTIYEIDDIWHVDSAMGDNFHCADSQGSHQPYYSSFGCQVVCGTAKRTRRPASQDSGAWPKLRDLAYGDGTQKSFTYALFSGRVAHAAAAEPAGSLSKMMRYGSTGSTVAMVQDALRAAGYATFTQMGRFTKGTFTAVRRFQKDKGLPPDGVVGPDTAALLGIANWPKG